MSYGKTSVSRSLAIRAAGLLLIVLGAVAMRRLYPMVQLEPRGAASIAELGLAALGFVSLSAGAALASLGAHVFDRIEISSRWAPAAIVEPAVVRLSHDELLSRFGLRAAAGSRDRLALPS